MSTVVDVTLATIARSLEARQRRRYGRTTTGITGGPEDLVVVEGPDRPRKG